MEIGLISASISRNAGGLFESVRHLAFGLNNINGLNVQIFSLIDQHASDDISAWEALALHLSKVKGPSSFGYSSDLCTSLFNSKLDIIHPQGLWMYPSIASLKWADATSKPYVITPRGMLDPWAVRNSYWKKRLAGLLFENAHLSGAACLHALCESEANAIRAYGLKNPICIIPNGINEPSNAIADTPEWRHQLPKEAKILFYLGRLHPKKGLRQLLEAWSNIHTKIISEEWHLVIAGWDQASHERIIKTLAENLNIQERVHFIGAQFGEQKHACYSHVDAFILPSFSEGLPMTVLEAWSYGLPVVMTPQCNLPEGFEVEAALRIDPDVQSIADGLIKLLSLSYEELSAMGNRGKLLTEQRFAWSAIAYQMAEVYKWILGKASKPECVVTK